MEAKASGAGLVYLCNPNNPTATVHTLSEVKEFVARMSRSSPGTTILIDEAYFEYVDDPGYATAIPVAIENPRVIVSRTFSKVFGMAGLRVGYAVGSTATIKALSRHQLPSGVNLLGAAAALASLNLKDHIEQQRRLNREAREFTRRYFETAGYKVVPSQTNFMMIDIRRDAKEFRAACRKRNVMIGRAFPPLTSHIRVTMGTMEEMRQAVEVFGQVLAGGSGV
jgi:histidinol-phosphate aminotransferase